MDGVAAVRDHAVPRDTCQEAFMVTELNQGNWSAALDQFTRRNTGRTVTVEVDSKEFGAQHESVNAPLRGVAYDRQDGRIAIMLGPLDGSEGPSDAHDRRADRSGHRDARRWQGWRAARGESGQQHVSLARGVSGSVWLPGLWHWSSGR